MRSLARQCPAGLREKWGEGACVHFVEGETVLQKR